MNRASYGEALLREADGLYRFARARGLEVARAEDVVQETLLAAWSQAEPPAPLTPWLFSVARNKIVDTYRRAARDVTASDLDFDAHGNWTRDPNAGLERLAAAAPHGQTANEDGLSTQEQQLAMQQVRRMLRHCIEALSLSLRRILVLRDVDDQTPDDVAALLHIDRKSVAPLLYRARASVRACLQHAQAKELP